jgi:hypothetical protein
MPERYRRHSAVRELTGNESPEKEIPPKVRGRPFQHGNPGRPRGSKNRVTRLLEELLDDEASKLIRKVIDLALGGNAKCLQLCWNNILPRRNGRPVDFSLPAINGPHDVLTAMGEVATAVSNGRLTAEEAGQLVHFLDSYLEAFTTQDVVTRLETLESQWKNKP